MIDVISNFLSSLKNGVNLKKSMIEIPKSRRVKILIFFLIRQGYLVGFYENHESGVYRVFINYEKGHPIFWGIFRISKPSRHVYISIKTLKYIHNQYFFFVLSTNVGYLSNTQALYKNIGGELICLFY